MEAAMPKKKQTSKDPSKKTRPRSSYYVYVIELDDAVGVRVRADKPSVYVGQSALPPEERYAQHRRGYRSSRYVRNHGVRLRPKFYRNYNPLPDRDAALATEAHLAKRLRKRGLTVYGGH
jgi:predicted GIY-YIG superfamily endonuclease